MLQPPLTKKTLSVCPADVSSILTRALRQLALSTLSVVVVRIHVVDAAAFVHHLPGLLAVAVSGPAVPAHPAGGAALAPGGPRTRIEDVAVPQSAVHDLVVKVNVLPLIWALPATVLCRATVSHPLLSSCPTGGAAARPLGPPGPMEVTWTRLDIAGYPLLGDKPHSGFALHPHTLLLVVLFVPLDRGVFTCLLPDLGPAVTCNGAV